ncbi:unnamed protein product [Penicillium pancosmium]
MNRFRKNKKVKEVKDTLGELEGGSSSSSPFSLKPSKKKDAPESTPQLDFTAALPPTDDFRTSLLMPKLSARFSMLREQDDPESKMGKASDDSVLFPKRASRLNLFGHNPNMLTDIDEVSSNDGSCRPSMALGRTDSYASGDLGYGTDDDRSQSGSMMSRARRADGNNLFGGRQKVYRIPVRPGGAPSPVSPGASASGMGKAVYEHDLNLSAFQKMRRKEKEERMAADEAARDSIAHEFEDANSTSSSHNRTTYSSTASGPTVDPRTSTAATSIDESQFGSSQSLPPYTGAPEGPLEARPPSAMSTPRNGSVRTRRLYGQGLTQAAQSQQNSTLNRLESLSRQRSGTPDSTLNRNYSRSAVNLRDRLQKLAIAEPATTSRPTSPPSSATSPKQAPVPEPLSKERISPTAATFGNAPPLSPPSSETGDGASLLAAALNPEDHGKATAMGLFNRPATGFDEQAFSRRQLAMHQGRATPPPRRSSPPRQAPRAESASSHYSSDAHHGMDQSRDASPSRPGVRTFYANSTASESGDEGDERPSYEVSSVTSEYGQSLQNSSTASKPPTPNGEHLETLPEVRYSDLGDLKPIEENSMLEATVSNEDSNDVPQRPDSPVLQAGFGLKGISSHLRQESDVSSIYPPPSPRLPQYEQGIQEAAVPEKHISSAEEIPQEEATRSSTEQPETSSPRAPSRHSSETTVNRSSEDSSDRGVCEKNPSWKEELNYHHRRDGSTETQREREEFAIELAERRKKVQEKLRSVAEGESRPGSPTTGRSTPDLTGPKAGNAFSLLKHKSSKPGFQRPDQNGLYGFNSSSTPALIEETWRHDERPQTNFGRNASTPMVPTERSFRSRMPTMTRRSNEESRESSRSRGPSPQPGFRSQRDRSGSEGSSRSKSRTRHRDRDDLQTVEEGTVIAHDNFVMPDNFEPPLPASVPGSRRQSSEFNEPQAGMYDRSPSAASGRFRSASRSGTPSFHYERPFQFPQAAHPPPIIGATPRPSPATPAYSANATPPLNDVPSDQSSTSLAAAAASSASALPQRAPGHAMLQKRPINKKLISEPTFVSSTSNVPTVGLPPGGISPPNGAPPLPPMNPRRRRGTQTILGAFRTDKHDSSRSGSPAPSFSDERSSFVDDEKRPQSRNRLRKTSSAGGSLSARARQEAMASPAPAVPQYPPPAIPVDGGMF